MSHFDQSVKTLTTDQFFWVKNKAAVLTPKRRAIVFVHGFGGNPEETWSAKGSSTSFYKLLASDGDLSDCNVYLFKYPTAKFNPPSLEKIVKQLQFMTDTHVKEESIIFLAHSMGGLVAMKYLIDILENGQKQRVSGLLLYGCPMSGVEFAKYAGKLPSVALSLLLGSFGSALSQLLPRNRQLEQLSPGDFVEKLNSDWLKRVLNGGHDAFAPHQRAWIPVRVVTGNDDWVVKESSARALYSDHDWISIPTMGHKALVKPVTRNDINYQIAKDFLLECQSWAAHDTLMGLRKILATISAYRSKMHFKHFKEKLFFEMSPFAKEHCGGFGVAGYFPFEVDCEYVRNLTGRRLAISCAIGSIGFKNLWDDECAFLHGVSVAPDAEGIRAAFVSGDSKPEELWAKLFEDEYVRVSGVELVPTAAVKTVDGLIRYFNLPDGFAPENEVRVEVGFRSLLEPTATGYTLKLPWMATGFLLTAFTRGAARYFVSTHAALSSAELAKEIEPGKIEYSTDELILPGSSIQFDWSPATTATEGHVKAAGA